MTDFVIVVVDSNPKPFPRPWMLEQHGVPHEIALAWAALRRQMTPYRLQRLAEASRN